MTTNKVRPMHKPWFKLLLGILGTVTLTLGIVEYALGINGYKFDLLVGGVSLIATIVIYLLPTPEKPFEEPIIISRYIK